MTITRPMGGTLTPYPHLDPLLSRDEKLQNILFINLSASAVLWHRKCKATLTQSQLVGIFVQKCPFPAQCFLLYHTDEGNATFIAPGGHLYNLWKLSNLNWIDFLSFFVVKLGPARLCLWTTTVMEMLSAGQLVFIIKDNFMVTFNGARKTIESFDKF